MGVKKKTKMNRASEKARAPLIITTYVIMGITEERRERREEKKI